MTSNQKAASCVTLSFDRVDFQIPIFNGDLLTFNAELVNVGRSSMVVLVTGSKRDMHVSLMCMVLTYPECQTN